MDFATVLEIVGLVCVVVAAWIFSPVLGLFALGGSLMFVGWLLERGE